MKAQQQLLTITPFGQIVSLQTKPGKGVDPRQFGRADIKRTTIIEWNEARQEWWIKFLNGNAKNHPACVEMWVECKIPLEQIPARHTVEASVLRHRGAKGGYTFKPGDTKPKEEFDVSASVLYFAEYDDAVTAEIVLVQALRIKFGHACV